MEQPELGKNEEEALISSSAELSEPETTAASQMDEAQPAAEIDEVPDTPSEDSEVAASESAAETTSGEGEGEVAATETTAETDNEVEENVGGIQRGAVLLGTVTRTTPNEIYVDLGEGREGIVPKREVELMSGKLLEQMQQGAEIHVYVVNPQNHRGETILSVNHAQEEMDWRNAGEYLENKEVYDGKIGGYNKGGLIVRFGRLRGFVPQSQISDKRLLDIEGDTPEERYSGMVNEQISVKVMEVDRSRNRLILSERAAMREVRQRRKESLITELEVGEIRAGRVVSLENFGAFVDVGGAEGLVHITELAWQHITHPRQILDVGQEVRVKIISVDPEKNRIGLSIKQLKADPWDELALRFGPGALVRGTVTKLTKFGAFARIHGLESVEGLIHISELSDERVEHPRDIVQKGDKLTLRVVKVDVKDRRLGLSLRRVNSAEFLDEDLKRAYLDRDDHIDDDVEEEIIIVDDDDDPDSDYEPEAIMEPAEAEEETSTEAEEETSTEAEEAEEETSTEVEEAEEETSAEPVEAAEQEADTAGDAG